MKFCTAINCMDGRVQIPVITYLRKRFAAEYVDIVSEPGPNRILAEQSDQHTVNAIFNRIKISVDQHHSGGIAVVGHYDCAGNPAPEEDQLIHTRGAVSLVRKQHPEIEIIGLWVNENWEVSEAKLT